MAGHGSRNSLGAAAVTLVITIAVLLFILAASNISLKDGGRFSLLLASAIVEVILCLPLILLLLRCSSWAGRWPVRSPNASWAKRNSLLILAGIIPTIMATSVVATTAAVVILDNPKMVLGREVPAVYVASFVIWIASVLLQAAYYALLAASTKGQMPELTPALTPDVPPSEVAATSRLVTASTIATDPFRKIAPSSLPSLTYSDDNLSERSSLSTHRPGSSWPASSRRGLLSRSHSQPRHLIDTVSRRPSCDEGFDFWDTSGVSDQMKEMVIHTKPLSKSVGLPTIPGSRSSSPAKALEGPFFNPSPDDSPPQSPLPQPPVSRSKSPPSGSPEVPKFPVLFPPAAVTPLSPTPPSSAPLSSTPQRQKQRLSRPPTLLLIRGRTSDDHIHPLFRTSSPTPPPSASPNTIVTAAPEAGEMINLQTLQRMRSTSQPSHSSPLQRSESFPDIRETRAPLSPISINMKHPAPSSRSGKMHQRKRSASLEGCIIRD